MSKQSCHHLPIAVVLFLGTFALLGLGGSLWLVAHDKSGEAIALVSGMTGTALGALASMLTQTAQRPQNDSQDVTVVNKPSDPVPITDSAPSGQE